LAEKRETIRAREKLAGIAREIEYLNPRKEIRKASQIILLKIWTRTWRSSKWARIRTVRN